MGNWRNRKPSCYTIKKNNLDLSSKLEMVLEGDSILVILFVMKHQASCLQIEWAYRALPVGLWMNLRNCTLQLKFFPIRRKGHLLTWRLIWRPLHLFCTKGMKQEQKHRFYISQHIKINFITSIQEIIKKKYASLNITTEDSGLISKFGNKLWNIINLYKGEKCRWN